MLEQTVVANAGAAVEAGELIGVPDLPAAFRAFDGPIDELKHRRYSKKRSKFSRVLFTHATLAPAEAVAGVCRSDKKACQRSAAAAVESRRPKK